MTTQKYYELLDNAPEKLAPIARLFSWSENYDYPKPATLYLDLTGYTEEEFGEGERLCGDKMPALGYLEIGMLADALQVYSDSPQDSFDYVRRLVNAENGWDAEEEEEN